MKEELCVRGMQMENLRKTRYLVLDLSLVITEYRATQQRVNYIVSLCAAFT